MLHNTDEALVIPAPVVFEMDYWIRKHLGVGPLLVFLDDIVEGYLTIEDLIKGGL